MQKNERRVVIAGAGGFGRELYDWVFQSPNWMSEHGVESVVFIDDGAPSVPTPAPVVSSVQDFEPTDRDLVLCAIGAPAIRRSIVEQLSAKGATFATFVDDRAIVSPRARIGIGSVVCPSAMLTADCTVGAHCQLNIASQVAHDSVLEDFVTLSPSVALNGNVTIRTGAFLGTAAVVIPTLEIGAGALIGAGAIVTKSVPAKVLAAGNPCVVKRVIS